MIVGVDPGLATAGAAAMSGTGELAATAGWASKKEKEVGDTRRRLDMLLEWVDAFVHPFRSQITLVVVEFPAANNSAGGRGRTDPRAYLAAGVVYGHVRSWGIPVLAPVPMTWRSALTKSLGVTWAKGAEVWIHQKLDERHKIIEKHGKTKGTHVLDAVGCATYGFHTAGSDLALEGVAGTMYGRDRS